MRGKEVALNALFLPKGRRYWIELDKKITELYLSGASYRQVKAILDRAMELDAGTNELMAALSEAGRESLISWVR